MSDAALPWPAPAKLNLFLSIVGRRADGYHELQTVFQLLDFGDQVHVEVRADGSIRRLAEVPGVAEGDDLALRAARLLQQRAGVGAGADIRVDKRIPMGGGLGGGSSDAATVLVALNYLWNAGLDQANLCALALELGADVPLFVGGRSAWAEGVGECLTPLELPPRWYLVVDPGAAVSTAALFADPQLTRAAPRQTISDFVSGLATGNAFEPVVRARHPRVAAALDWLGGIAPARLSGTGGCVFAAFGSRDEAEWAARRCPSGFTTIVARGLDRSPLLDRLQGAG
jgi:4-diphosphocytidyl-2-C-methyl-D-erythritol kinase